jgi:hypothetical protein
MPIVIAVIIIFAVIVALVEYEAKQGIRILTVRERMILYPVTFALLFVAMWIGARSAI